MRIETPLGATVERYRLIAVDGDHYLGNGEEHLGPYAGKLFVRRQDAVVAAQEAQEEVGDVVYGGIEVSIESAHYPAILWVLEGRGGVPWPVLARYPNDEAEAVEDLEQTVRDELAACHPTVYEQEWEPGNALPTIEPRTVAFPDERLESGWAAVYLPDDIEVGTDYV